MHRNFKLSGYLDILFSHASQVYEVGFNIVSCQNAVNWTSLNYWWILGDIEYPCINRPMQYYNKLHAIFISTFSLQYLIVDLGMLMEWFKYLTKIYPACFMFNGRFWAGYKYCIHVEKEVVWVDSDINLENFHVIT